MKNTTRRRSFIKQLAGTALVSSVRTTVVAGDPVSTELKHFNTIANQPSEQLAWDSLRGHFEMNFTLDPPVARWETVNRKDAKKSSGEYQANGYFLKINERELGKQTRVIDYEITRNDGQSFRMIGNQVQCKTSYSGVYKLFTPGTMTQQTYRIDLPFHFRSQSGAQMDHPVVWMQQTDGTNTFTFGLLEQIHTVVTDGATYRPENGGEAPGIANSYVRVELNRTVHDAQPVKSYKDGIYINADPGITWFDALEDYSKQVDSYRNFRPQPESSWALNPMWHSWYAHGDRIDEKRIREDALLARKLGVTTIELDAGWNIPDNVPYSFDAEGDYFFDPGRFPDPNGMIKEMHAAGQRVILHVAPLLMGKNSKAWNSMKDCKIRVDGKQDDHLDPRLKKVHDFLLDAWQFMFTKYDIDGLWYDFLEVPERVDVVPAGIPVVSHDLYEAYTMLMQALYKKALEVNKNAVIILRRNSANLNSKTYCTHVWPMDVPQDYNMNRRDIVFMKTFGEGVLTHACCTSWAISESNVNVARQMASIVLAGVPSFSVILKDSPAAHNEIITAWLSFYDKNKKDLVMGRTTPLLPTPPSAILKIESKKQAFFGFFEAVPGLVEVAPVSKITLVNAYSKRTTTRIEGVSGSWNAEVFDQTWKSVAKTKVKADGKGGLTINLDGPTECHTVVLTKQT